VVFAVAPTSASLQFPSGDWRRESYCAHLEKCVPNVSPIVVLCVDDDPRALIARSLLLSAAGYDVQTASSSDAALRIFRRCQADVVIADQFLPSMNGFALAAEIKTLKPEALVVLLTASTELISVLEHTDLILTKCIAPQQFLATIEKLVASRGLYLPHDPEVDGKAQ
jgi:DNA-binding response OmpR family regulator